VFKKDISRRSFLTVSAMAAATMALDWRRIALCAEKMGPKDQYQTVVIGAGLGGLSCAAFLAQQGIPVTVVEQKNVPGGYATAFDRGRFCFDVSLQGTSVRNSSTGRLLERLGLLESIETVPLPQLARIRMPGVDISIPQQDPGACVEILSRRFPAEADGIRKLVDFMIAVSEESDRMHRNKGKFIRALFPIQYSHMWSVRKKSAADVMNDFLQDESLKNVLTALWGYFGLPPSRLSGFYFASGVGDYLKNGCFYIKPRSQQLSNQLAESIQANGGRIFYGRSVRRILLKGGAVNGVTLSDGSALPARAVVSNASALTTFGRMLPEKTLPEKYADRLSGYQPSISSFIVWLGLKAELRGRIKGFSHHITDGSGPEKEYRTSLSGDVDKMAYTVNVYDNLFEGYSAPGTSTVQLLAYCGYDAWRPFKDAYFGGDKSPYEKEKDRWADILIRRAEKDVIPGLSDAIEVKVAATPLTNWRYTGNTDGAIYGFAQDMNNTFINRIENRTPVRGLYLTGAWGSPGGGYRGVLWSGENTFRDMMEDWAEDGDTPAGRGATEAG